ncbi:MAG: hypothetical protein PUF12_13570 [Thermoflexaceae bacterium]|nr:hypothetical protein [Thermoflexaceae bacterium]
MINGVNSTQSATYTAAYSATPKTEAKETASSNETGVVYESTVKSSYKKDNSALIAQLKADSQNRINQMQSLVSQMFEKQGIKIGTADDMWKTLASGNFTADAATIAQAKEDISEDGYWGVKQTSDRIFDFAMALSGGDSETMEKMKAAVEKGFQQATKSWGKELPGISSDTYDAVMQKFDDFFNKESSVEE